MRAPDGASSSAIPRAELTRRREEFWDTSPSYGGSREIWDVLKAAVEAEDIHTARLFVESAGIIVVTPDMTCVFDERGAVVEDPRWVIADPTNVVGGAGTSRREEEEPDRTPEDPNVEEPDRTREDLNPEADESPNDAERRTIEAAAEAASEGDERRRARRGRPSGVETNTKRRATRRVISRPSVRFPFHGVVRLSGDRAARRENSRRTCVPF